MRNEGTILGLEFISSAISTARPNGFTINTAPDVAREEVVVLAVETE